LKPSGILPPTPRRETRPVLYLPRLPLKRNLAPQEEVPGPSRVPTLILAEDHPRFHSAPSIFRRRDPQWSSREPGSCRSASSASVRRRRARCRWLSQAHPQCWQLDQWVRQQQRGRRVRSSSGGRRGSGTRGRLSGRSIGLVFVLVINFLDILGMTE
jgi:hypothetical protein